MRDAPAAGARRRRRRDRRAASPRRRSTGASRGSTTRAGRVETAGDEGGRVQLGPRLQPAGLAARRPRAAARQGARRPRVLEGARPRPLRRPRLAPGPAPARRGPGRRSCRPARPASRAGRQQHRGHDAQPALGHVRHRRHHDGGRRRGRLPDRRRRLQRAATGSAAATPTRPRSTRPSPTDRQLRENTVDRLRGLAALLPRDLPARAGAAPTGATRSTSAAAGPGRVADLGRGRRSPRPSASASFEAIGRGRR